MKDFTFKKIGKYKDFQGALQEYKVGGESVAVGFTVNCAYIMSDDEGLYTANDIKYNINKMGLDVESARETDAIFTASGRVEPIFTNLGFSEADAQDIEERFNEINELGKQEDFKFNF